MRTLMAVRRFLTPGFLLGALVAYLLPFAALESDRLTLFTLSGAQLVTSETFYMTGRAEPFTVPPDPFLVVAAVLALVALLSRMGNTRLWRRVSLALAAGAFLAMTLFPFTTSDRIPAAMSHIALLRLATGYWISLFCCLMATAVMASETRRTRVVADAVTSGSR
jgi:hypothetical protein